MIDQDLLRDLTESYLKSLIAEVSGSLSADFDSLAQFAELGLDSFYVLKIIRRLETDFGTLPKSLLFENFNINDLAKYFVAKHEKTLVGRFNGQLQAVPTHGVRESSAPKLVTSSVKVAVPAASKPQPREEQAEAIRILEKDAIVHPQLGELVRTLFELHKAEGSVSRGTRKIAPNLFIGRERRGYFHYGRSKKLILVYGYTGPKDHLPQLLEEMARYCEARGFEISIMGGGDSPSIGSIRLTATPFGAMQRIGNLREFTLDGGPMRRLRYQVSKFQKSGACRTEEYRCGTDQTMDGKIAGVIDRWCEARAMVNPLVHEVKGEILAGTLPSEHRLFLTFLDGTLQNVIIITAMSAAENGYLMDMEFYPPDMPLGGLEFAIVQIIDVLVKEGRDVLSLGGTYGCKLEASPNADPAIDKLLDDLRAQNIFNDEGNLQFKNKFRPENTPIYLCRPEGSGNPDSAIDIIMMIADPDKMQTSDAENHNFGVAAQRETSTSDVEDAPRSATPRFAAVGLDRFSDGGKDRAELLAAYGFNPLAIPQEHVDFDLKTDSWAQLTLPAIETQMSELQARLQQPVRMEDALGAIFPFSHFVLTASGQAAERLFFKAWGKKGLVPQNLLFPSTILHQLDQGFEPREIPHGEVFHLGSEELFRGNLEVDALKALVAEDHGAIACVCIEVGNNAAGGYPVSLQHLAEVRAVLAPHSIPLVMDATRVVENARQLIERQREHAGRSVWAVVRETLSLADMVIGSLTKDFCVDKGGIIAINDAKLHKRLQEVVHEEGSGVDLVDEKLIALALRNRKHIEASVTERMENVRLLWQAATEHGLPLASPAGGHCVLIDVKQIPEFMRLKEPVASFVAWLYRSTGIRAGAHSVGMQKRTSLNDLVRLAIPVGLPRHQMERVIERLVQAFEEKANIPELGVDGRSASASGLGLARYRLLEMHNVTENDAAIAAPASAMQPFMAGAPSAQRSSAESTSKGEEKETSEDSFPTATRVKPWGGVQDIAIVGMSGRYPKAKNPGELWQNLAAGRDCIEDLPAERHEQRRQHGNAERYRGGFIDDVDKFDSLFFNISPREAEMLDPQERLFLEVAWEAIEDAGYYPEILAEEGALRNIGVYVGAVWSMYQIVGVEQRHAGNHFAPNSFLWSIANRVSYWMNLSGPSLTVDTACSSSLTALYLACESIRSGECPSALVGGVNLDLHQAKLNINQVGGALSADGVCRSFGKGANGYVAGEGVGALFLKPLQQALADRDHVYGVIKSAVVNHGGRTSGYFVPNPAAQSNVIVAALRKANIGAGTIGYVEAHGTGTELGDPIEIAGVSRAFSEDNVADQSCAIGSIKSNIGHLEAAAGIVSVAKVLLQMEHRQLAPSLHSSELNEFIDFEHSPFYVPQKLEEWKAKEVDGVALPLRAGISSFGAGGANAHIILESFEPAQPVSEEAAQSLQRIFPLSARTEDQLRETAIRLARFLADRRVDLDDVAYTLQHGRKSFEHRLAMIASTQEELVGKLVAFIDGRKFEDGFVGHVKQAEGVTRLLSRKEKQEFIRLLSQSRDPLKIAGLWAEGLLADWQGSPMTAAGRTIPLPTYPFAGKRHWIGAPASVQRTSSTVAGLHPMVDSNESTFERQLFKKTFHDRDFFIYDHHVAGIPTLPGVAYLELARKAGEIAAGRPVRRIQNILWVSPIAISDSLPKDVFIELKPNGEAVQFEVFSEWEGKKTLHSQGKLLYTTAKEAAAEPEYVDLAAIRARCSQEVDGRSAYPLFNSVGLNLGPSFQVLQEIYKSDSEVLGVLKLPEARQGELQSLLLHPSLIDGSLQAGMAARLGENVGEMMVPYSIGEVEILHPLQELCYSHTTEAKEGKKASRVLKSNVLILDPTGKVLARIRESTGVPLGDVHKKETATDEEFARLSYGYDWERAPLPANESSAVAAKTLLLFDTGETLRELYLARLKASGADDAEVVLVRPGSEFQELDARTYEINPQTANDFKRVLERLADRACPVEEICFAWPVHHPHFREEGSLRESMEAGVSSFLFLCQAMVQCKLENRAQLVYLYATAEDEVQPHHEAMGGFVKTLRGEYPKLVCKTMEVRRSNDGYEEIFDALWAELRGRSQDAIVVRYEAGERSVRKLKAFDLEAKRELAPSDRTELREGGTYLITGGAGGLGLIFAEFLGKQYKAKLILTGRSKLSSLQQLRVDDIERRGAEVLYRITDVSDGQEVRELLREGEARFGQIHGIIHSAGVVRDSYVRNKTPEEMAAVFASKVHGTLHLDEATRDRALDFLVLFSSLAAITGNVGQCDYSFANHFMDSFAADRERLRAKGERSGKTLSLNWALWADGGMKPDEQTELLLRKAMGMKPLSTATGLEAFVRGLASERSQFAVVEGIQEKLELAWSGKKPPAPATTAAPVHSDVASATTETEDGALPLRFQNDLAKIVMELLKLEAADLSADKILLDLGFDSIGLTTFANAVNERFLLDITPILFFDYPSIGEIAKHLAVERRTELLAFYRDSMPASAAAAVPSGPPVAPLSGAQVELVPSVGINKGWNPAALNRQTEAAVAPASLSPHLRFVQEPIAIVGMSGVMPQSDDLHEFWENLRNSKDLITVIPPDRWDWEEYYGDPLKEANKSNSKWGGFMREVDKFDPLFFGISPREAEMMDPQQRIFLEHVWKAIEDSGHKVSDLSGTKTGLFLGVGTTDYAGLLGSRGVALDGYTASGNSHSVTANRVSFLLNLRGPSAPIDTACSSSLVAFHRALESIHSGSCEMAIVGGVQVMLSPAAYISFGMAGMLSGDGKCKTFDKGANGYVRGEGCGAVFLKPLSKAEADGDHVYAVIKATAENHGGRVTTMTAPNSVAQMDLLIEAYEKAQVDPATVGYIECHGTGTGLGDPIEIQALSKAFAELYKRHNKRPAEIPHCGLSSVKTNIGHLETGAGIAGVLKALLAIQHKQIPANLHLQEVNPYINLTGTPFYIADRLTEWKAPVSEDGSLAPRRAGVSSFGFGGANAHVVLEEYIPASRPAAVVANELQLIVLSAKNEERLRAYVRSLSEYLERGSVELADLAYTLQVGRDEMQARAAWLVSSLEELKQKLSAIVVSEEWPRDGYRNGREVRSAVQGTDAEKTAFVQDLISRRDLAGLAESWVAGTKIDWRLLHQAGARRRLSAPTYPFARERYWIPAGAETQSETRRPQSAATEVRLHPLIHRNVSTLIEQKFTSRFTGAEFFLADHRVKTEPVLPAVAYIEMAAAAGELAGERKVRFLSNMVWLSPITVGKSGQDVEVSLLPARNGVEFAVKSGEGESAVTHCRGQLAYLGTLSPPNALNLAEIRERCATEMIDGADWYRFLSTSELNLGPGFQVVQRVDAGESECLAVLHLPEHLQEDAGHYWLHPSLLDGALHTAIGFVKRRSGDDRPWSVPYSAAEIQVFRSLQGARYAHASWDPVEVNKAGSAVRMQLHLLDAAGEILLRVRDFVAKPLPARRIQERAVPGSSDTPSLAANATLHSLRSTWSPAADVNGDTLPMSSRIVLLDSRGAALEWVRQSYPNARPCDVAQMASEALDGDMLSHDSFDQLLWIAPDLDPMTGHGVEGSEPILALQEEGILQVFRIVKTLLDRGHGNKKLQWTLLTGRTQRVTAEDTIEPAHAGIVGLVGSLAKEYPHWDVRVLDLDSLQAVTASGCLSQPWDELGNVRAHRQGQWFQQGLELLPAPKEGTSLYRKGGVYVVVGGAGGVGEVWSRFMIEHYGANLIWIGRRECDASIEDKIKELGLLGPAPLYIAADATDHAALERARVTILEKHPAIHGVVHSAIVLRDQSLLRMDEESFRAGLTAKVDVSVQIDRVFGGDALDFMLFFSSIISFFRSPGQSNYAAGCAFKDSFAQRLQQERAYPVKIMNWGYWGTVGVAADPSHHKIMARLGMGLITPDEGMAALQGFMRSDVEQMTLIKTLNAEAPVGASLTEAITRHLSRQISAAAPASPAVEIKNTAPAVTRDSARDAGFSAQRTVQMGSSQIQQVIVTQLSRALRLDAGMIRGDAPLADYGLDSIIGVNFVRTLNEVLLIELDPTKLFEYSTVDQLTQYITTLSPGMTESQPSATTPVEVRTPSGDASPNRIPVSGARRFLRVDEVGEKDQTRVEGQSGSAREVRAERIAIIGMSGRFAQSETLEEFWQHLAQGSNLVREVSRWSAADCSASGSNGHAYCSQASSIDTFDRFDPGFFGIPAREALYMDPQQRLFLEESWKALEDAGYAGKGVQEKQCGVYVGCGTSNYSDLFGDDPPAQAWWGNSHSIVPSRIAYHLDLQGPAVAVDTACSSGLVAVHLACQGLWCGETEMALAGGVYVQATSGFHQVGNRAGMLSPDGKCYSFDARANGFVPGEAVGVVVLKRLSDAQRDGDHIYGVIAGSGVNQDGRSNGLTAPNGRAQERLERSVYERFTIDPGTIQMFEAHGTGTLLGDSIEHGAMTRAFRAYTERQQFCALGSVKTNIGHAGNAAGIASLLKLLLSLKHGQIPPSLHFQSPSPGIDLGSGPFYVNTELKDWPQGEDRARRGAVSSFGFGGTNAHLVIEEAPSQTRAGVDVPASLLLLSARSGEQLREHARNLLEHLRGTPDLALSDVSFTLFVGRMHLSHRLACVTGSLPEAVEALERWLETGEARQVHTGEVPEGGVREQPALRKFGNYCVDECRSATDDAAYVESLDALAGLFVQGYSIDLQALFSTESKRVPLPTYPFARERYWVTGAPARPEFGARPLALQGIDFDREVAATTEEVQPRWLFSKEIAAGSAVVSRNGSMGAAEKMELFLKQATAVQLQVPIESVPLDRSYFDLGLPSLSIAHLIRNLNQLLEEELSPSALFDYTDIKSLATYLAKTYPAKIDVLHVIRIAGDASPFEQSRPLHPAKPAPLRPKEDVLADKEVRSPEHADVSAAQAGMDRDQVLERVLWQADVTPDDGYEIVTF